MILTWTSYHGVCHPIGLNSRAGLSQRIRASSPLSALLLHSVWFKRSRQPTTVEENYGKGTLCISLYLLNEEQNARKSTRTWQQRHQQQHEQDDSNSCHKSRWIFTNLGCPQWATLFFHSFHVLSRDEKGKATACHSCKWFLKKPSLQVLGRSCTTSR